MHKTNKQIYKSTNLQIAIASFICLLGYLLIGLFNKASAQSTIPLVVAPARQTLEADPGKIINFAVRFYNTGTEPVSGSFKVADFIVDDNEGNPSFLEGPTTLSNRYAAADWVSLNAEKGTIPGTGMVIVSGKIQIPNNANPGGKYFAVFFEPETSLPSSTSTNTEAKKEEVSSVAIRIAGLVYLKVNGPISEGASITKFSAPGFLEYGPITITTEIKNAGDYHITPKGQITIKNMFGKVVAGQDLEKTNVFPGSSRIFTNKLGTKWMIGKFTANLNASYGESGKTLVATVPFWVFPWKVATVIVLGIAIIIIIIMLIIKKVGKKQKKLEKELSEEKSELEKLKEAYKDKIDELTINNTPISSFPEEEKTNKV
ncbi:MAG: hypothetical protein PHZ25_03435 [Candidatus Pacebacteria bacterium]|nr:hypothetical protein [Candidatus Paceibacterota bacterium]